MYMRMILGCFLLSLSTSGLLLADSRMEEKIAEFIKENRLPGMVTLIVKDNKVLHYSAKGKVNVDGNKPLEKDAIFRLFSMGKPIVAIGLLQLVEKGKVSLDDDIRKFLPAFEPFEYEGKLQTVTVHQLLTHTAGFGYGGGMSNWTDFRYLIANPLSPSNTLVDLVDDLSGIDLKFEPGAKWQYSIASDIQGALIEAISGMTLDKYLKQNIFDPLEMKDTAFWVAKEKAPRLVDQYAFDAEGIDELAKFDAELIDHVESGEESDYLEKPKLLSGGGGLVSTTKDFSHFVSMLLDEGTFKGKRLLSRTLVKQMLSSHTQGMDTWFLPKLYNNTGFGYGVGVKEKVGDRRAKGSFYWAGMGGTVFWADPQNGLMVIAMMQVEDGWVALERWLVPEVYQLISRSSEH